VARYECRIEEPLEDEAIVTPEVEARALQGGTRIRALDPGRFHDELRPMFELSLAAFADNAYYTPIDFGSFVAQYERLRSLLDPELVLLAEDQGSRLLGFLFAYGDPVAAGRPTRLVVKTVASAPAARGMGLGSLLLDRVERRGFALGYRSAIHALMHVDNFSMKMSARHRARLFRRYALYERIP
jgi:ribosomal protein S18 acetylase RimI-like enzyme